MRVIRPGGGDGVRRIPLLAKHSHRTLRSPLTNAVSRSFASLLRSHLSIGRYVGQHTCNHPGVASGKTKSLLNVRFGKRLGALRKQRNWTFVYLAEHSGLDDTFLLALEHGTKEPCLNTLDIRTSGTKLTAFPPFGHFSFEAASSSIFIPLRSVSGVTAFL